MWEGPRANAFLPNTVAVLPPLVGDLDGAADTAHEAVITSLRRENVYPQIMGAEQVNGNLRNDKEAVGLLITYYNKLETTGDSDREAAKRLGELLQVDAMLVVKVVEWEYIRTEGDNLAKVALALRLIDAQEGSTIWKARHRRTKSYLFFKPALHELAESLLEEMVENIPQ